MTSSLHSARKSYKPQRKIPLWAKFLTGGMMALVIFMLLLPLVPMKTQAYNARLQEKTDKIHAQIIEGKFHDVFIEGHRDLIKYNDEAEFTKRLAIGQKYLTGKYEKTGGDFVEYDDLHNKLNDLFGRPALVASGYTLKNEAGNARESFYWIVRGGEFKLVDYQITPRNY